VYDHGRTCEHGSLWPHWIQVSNAKWWQEPECLGGRRMFLRRVGDDLWKDITEATTDAGERVASDG
jgi:hypothetical protein